MVQRLRVISNELRRIRLCVLVSMLFLVVVMPIMVYLEINRAGAVQKQEMEMIVQQYSNIFYPVCLLFLFIGYFHIYIEGEGRERLYLNSRLKIQGTMILFLLLAVAMLIVSVLFYAPVLTCFKLFYIKNVMILFGFWGIYYFLIYFFSNITATAVSGLLLYIFLTNSLRIFDMVSMSACELASTGEFFVTMRVYLAVGLLGMIGGIIYNKRYKKF